MGLTSDRNDPRLTYGADEHPVSQAEVYLVLSNEERAKGFVRPVRTSYVHVGPPGPAHSTRALTDEELVVHADAGYVAFETYPDGEHVSGRYWTPDQLDAADAVLAVVADWLAAQPIHDGTAAGLFGLEPRAIQRDRDVRLLRGES